MTAATAGPGRLAASTRNLWLSQVAARFFRMAALFVAARLLGAATFGTFALLLTVVELIAVSSRASYTDFLTREVAQSPAARWRPPPRVPQVPWAFLGPITGISLGVPQP